MKNLSDFLNADVFPCSRESPAYYVVEGLYTLRKCPSSLYSVTQDALVKHR